MATYDMSSFMSRTTFRLGPPGVQLSSRNNVRTIFGQAGTVPTVLTVHQRPTQIGLEFDNVVMVQVYTIEGVVYEYQVNSVASASGSREVDLNISIGGNKSRFNPGFN